MTISAAAVSSPRRRRLSPWMLGVAGVTFLAGLLFGYDQGVISGALPLIENDLGLSTIQAENKVPETKGRSLEEIQEMWESGIDARATG